MNSKNFLTAGIAGGITYFFLGWLVYGMLMADFMKTNSGTATGVDREQMLYWALIVGNLLAGFLLSYVFTCVGNIKTASVGAKVGAWIGFFLAGTVDFSMYGMSNLYTLNAVFADIVGFTLISAIAGTVVAWVAGKAKA